MSESDATYCSEAEEIFRLTREPIQTRSQSRLKKSANNLYSCNYFNQKAEIRRDTAASSQIVTRSKNVTPMVNQTAKQDVPLDLSKKSKELMYKTFESKEFGNQELSTELANENKTLAEIPLKDTGTSEAKKIRGRKRKAQCSSRTENAKRNMLSTSDLIDLNHQFSTELSLQKSFVENISEVVNCSENSKMTQCNSKSLALVTLDNQDKLQGGIDEKIAADSLSSKENTNTSTLITTSEKTYKTRGRKRKACCDLDTKELQGQLLPKPKESLENMSIIKRLNSKSIESNNLATSDTSNVKSLFIISQNIIEDENIQKEKLTPGQKLEHFENTASTKQQTLSQKLLNCHEVVNLTDNGAAELFIKNQDNITGIKATNGRKRKHRATSRSRSRKRKLTKVEETFISTQKSILPEIYPSHFKHQIPAAKLTSQLSLIKCQPPTPPLTMPDITESSEIIEKIPSLSSSPSLPESLQDIFNTNDLHDLLSVERVAYRLYDYHIDILSAVLNINLQYLQEILNKITKLNSKVLRKFKQVVSSSSFTKDCDLFEFEQQTEEVPSSPEQTNQHRIFSKMPK